MAASPATTEWWAGRLQAGAVQYLLDEPLRLREVFRVGVAGPADYAEAVRGWR